MQFDHYEPPFVHYGERGGSGVRVLLISQPGDQSTLFGLYDILQTLEIVPLDGERERGRPVLHHHGPQRADRKLQPMPN